MFACSYCYMKIQDLCLLVINNETFPNLQLELGQSYGAPALAVVMYKLRKTEQGPNGQILT